MTSLELTPPPVDGGETIFVQCSDTILTDPMVGDYHRSAYANMPGYHFPEHYMEVPYWIALSSGMMPSDRYDKSLHIVTDVEESIRELKNREDATLLFSVMEANTEYVQQMVRRLGNRAVMGGYTDPTEYAGLGHVRYLQSLGDLPKAFAGLDASAAPDYSLFEGERCIPRFTLSTGCAFKCKFCTVPTVVEAISGASAEAQTEALRPLDFELIYMDDKSFGQAPNWREVGAVGDRIRRYNPDYAGFIAQTPPTLAIRPGFLEEAISKGLRYLETGVEVADDEYLKNLRKPYRLKHLDQLCEKVRDLDLPLIPNFIMGLPGDDYEKTIEWTREHRSIIALGNMSVLATHYGSERGGLLPGDGSREDSDQNAMHKSWLSPNDERRMRDAMAELYRLTSSNQPGSWQYNKIAASDAQR